ncbi:flagellar motor protein MotB [Paenibacillus sp. LHD-117]|uniref:flagellar motor protein MotB n=1 Tax=Paenibacillus sp. LHD-117 TaxID=3071412 RepID=UPI0027DEF092|nr:flagellar motor protein MotB [Paenibacillus sp. LHD-117]MDQ6422223.1 flagellar motor protein MotB [Paenibacillus sp. LHD-117]
MSKKRKHDDHEEHVDESWLIPYADLLTLLLALFIVLYSMNSIDVKKFEEMSQAFSIALSNGSGVLELPSIVQEGEDPTKKEKTGDDKKDEKNQESEAQMNELIKQEQAELEDLKKKIDDYIDKNGLTSDLETKLNMSQLLITISDNALFAPAQASIKPESKELATAIATMLTQYPNYDVIVAGHTDDTPINNFQFRSNWDLSSMRAVRFMDVMLENKKLDPKRFSAIGYGEYHPVAGNDTAAGKAKNRRVEVSILHTYVNQANPQTLKVDGTAAQ